MTLGNFMTFVVAPLAFIQLSFDYMVSWRSGGEPYGLLSDSSFVHLP